MFQKLMSFLMVLSFGLMLIVGSVGCSTTQQAQVQTTIDNIAADAAKLYPSAKILVQVVQANYPAMMALFKQTANPQVQLWLTAADSILTMIGPFVLSNQPTSTQVIQQGLAEGNILNTLQSQVVAAAPAVASSLKAIKQ